MDDKVKDSHVEGHPGAVQQRNEHRRDAAIKGPTVGMKSRKKAIKARARANGTPSIINPMAVAIPTNIMVTSFPKSHHLSVCILL